MQTLSKLTAAKSGTVAVLFAFLVVPLIGIMGLSVDSIRMYQTHADLRDALEIAMTAGLRARTPEEANALMRGFFEANWTASGHEIVHDGTLSVRIDEHADTTELIGVAKYQMPTVFLRIVGKPRIELSARVAIDLAQPNRNRR